MEALTAFGFCRRCPLACFSSASPRTHSLLLLSRRRSLSTALLVRRIYSDDGAPELDEWDRMELQFGRLLGEYPNLTLAKILARKANPDASYMDVEKEYIKKKGKLNIDSSEFSADLKLSNFSGSTCNSNSIVRDKSTIPKLKLSRPSFNKQIGATEIDVNSTSIKQQKGQFTENIDKQKDTPNVALRKPVIFCDDSVHTEDPSQIKTKRNLRKSSSEKQCDVTLLKKPEIQIPSNVTQYNSSSEALFELVSNEVHTSSNILGSTSTPEIPNAEQVTFSDNGAVCNGKTSWNSSAASFISDTTENSFDNDISSHAALLDKPQRNRMVPFQEVLHGDDNNESSNSDNLPSSSEEEHFISLDQEVNDTSNWRRAEYLVSSGERGDIELISCSRKGFVVSFGSILGFLPYKNLGSKWKFLAFESWLREKGLDPSSYRKNLGIWAGFDLRDKSTSLESSKTEKLVADDRDNSLLNMSFEELFVAYDQEKTKFLSSFIGQKIRAFPVLVEKESEKLIFSVKPKEKEESVERKRSVMANLSVGDVVVCLITKITYFCIFVEVEGVPALIPHSEVSWDTTLDPSSFYKVGQTLHAKVCHLDFRLERITLSLKEIKPDPLEETLGAFVGDQASSRGTEVAGADSEWSDVDFLMEELQNLDGVHGVSKGHFFLSPGWAPTFQVYMSSASGDQYKLLARYENKVQEVKVESSMDKEQMKAAILACTSRVG